MMLTERFPEFAPHLEEFVAVCHRLYEQGFVCAWDGNVSLRVGEQILVTPTHLCKGDVRVEDLIVVDRAGRQLFGERQPSSELKVHLAVYVVKPEISSVVHAHPLYATALYRTGRLPQTALLMEAAESLGAVPLVPFIDHGTQALADAVGRAMTPEVRACVLERHGTVTCGRSLEEAYFLTESLERLAKTETILATVNF